MPSQTLQHTVQSDHPIFSHLKQVRTFESMFEHIQPG